MCLITTNAKDLLTNQVTNKVSAQLTCISEMEESKQESMFEDSADSYIDTAKKVCQVFDGNEREEALDKLRELMMDNWRDAHEFMLQVLAQREVEDRMKLPDLDIDEVSLHSTG